MRRVPWLISIVLLALVAACGSPADEQPEVADPGAEDDAGEADDATVPGWDADAPDGWDDILEAAREEGRVVVGGRGDAAEAMAEAFERDTGITLDWIAAPGGELSARLAQEVAADSVTMDLKLGGAQEVFVDYEAILEPIAPQLILPSVVGGENWRAGELPWSDPGEEYIFRSLDGSSVTYLSTPI